MQRTGRIDHLVNNAGGALLPAAEETSPDQAKALFGLNFFGMARVTNAVLPTMRQQRSGRIINISSVVGFLPSPYSAHDAATKHAIEGYPESLDHEVRTFGIRVVVVEPAFTRTALDHNEGKPDHPLAAYEPARQVMTVVWAEAIRMGDPETVAATVTTAASAARRSSVTPPGGRPAVWRCYGSS